jgi:hypothetical protein
MTAQVAEAVLPRVSGRHRDRALASARKCRAIQLPVLPPALLAALLAALHSSTDERSQDKPVPCRTGRCGRPRRPSSRVNLETLVGKDSGLSALSLLGVLRVRRGGERPPPGRRSSLTR